MRHSELQGTHFQMGRNWGEEMARAGIGLLEQVPFPVGEEQRAFARTCRPLYGKHFPLVLEEIQGLAKGQNCPAEELEAVLFSMYALVPQSHCTCFAVSNQKGVFLGRNSDFWASLAQNNHNVIYRFSDGGHAFTANTTAFVEMEDGVNEKGLAVGMTAVAGTAVRPGFNAGMLVRYVLEHCEKVAEALAALKKLPTASAQTLVLADKTGDMALVELAPQTMAVGRPGPAKPFVGAVNRFSLPAMAPFQRREVDDWRSAERWDTMTKALTAEGETMTARAATALLAGERGFLCQYDRSEGKDTVWSVVYALTEGSILRAEGNPGRIPFQRDDRFSF